MMQEILTPLTLQPGVRVAAVISDDGVPVCVLERSAEEGGRFVDCTTSSQADMEGQRIEPASLVALAASWVDDVMRAGGQIAWELPRRMVLAATQGTLLVQQGPNAHVMVVAEPGMHPDTYSLPLEAAVERLHRLLRDLGRFDPDQNAAPIPSGPTADAELQQPVLPSAAEYAAGGTPDQGGSVSPSLTQPGTTSSASHTRSDGGAH